MSTKVLHTSDWHLGKKLFKQSRLQEQKLFLNWLTETIIERDISILLISGDIFDVPNPPNEATKLYFSFLNEVSERSKCEVVIIPGNHDSSAFISAPLEILKKHKIHIISGLNNYKEKNIVQIQGDSNVEIKALPYFRTYELYNEIEEIYEKVEPDLIESYLKDFFNYWPCHNTQSYKIIMGHHAFGSFSATGSEQALMLSGLESIPTHWLGDNFDYMALGHIHKPQSIDKNKNVFYSGSPIPLRFSEKHNKKCNLITIEGNKGEVSFIDIPTFRHIIQIKTTKDKIFSDIDKALEGIKNELEAFIEIIIKLDEPDNKFNDQVFDYINNKSAKLLSFIPEYTKSTEHEDSIGTDIIYNNNISELFQIYYKQKYPESSEVPKQLLKNFVTNLEELNNEDRQSQD